MRGTRTKEPRIQTATEDFRTYEPETFTEDDGSKIRMRKCEELVDGRWEPFYTVISRDREWTRFSLYREEMK